jgi:3-oxoacyl-[acyl-carrier protein] reductase
MTQTAPPPVETPSIEQPVYVIFGATGGIGTALCHQFSTQQGAQGHTAPHGAPRLFLVARDASRLEALSAQCGNAPFATADATQSDQVDAAMAQAKEHYGVIDGVTNLVGSIFLKPPHLTRDADFLEHVAINLHSAFFVLRAAVRHMERGRGGAIALVSTVAARFGLPNHEVIAAAKGGINGLVMAAAATYAPHNIRVNAVAPGLIATPLTQALTKAPAMAQASAALHPLGRIGRPQDIAAALAFLLDPTNSFITGQTWGIDGGMSRARPQVTAAARASHH